jgi:hypothetical protein
MQFAAFNLLDHVCEGGMGRRRYAHFRSLGRD